MRTLAATILALFVLAPAAARGTDGQEIDGPSPGSKPKHVRIAPSAQQRAVWHGEAISLSLKDADLVEVLRSFARLADVNLVIDPAVQGKVTLELHDVPWDQALSVILKSHRLGVEVSGAASIGSSRSKARSCFDAVEPCC